MHRAVSLTWPLFLFALSSVGCGDTDAQNADTTTDTQEATSGGEASEAETGFEFDTVLLGGQAVDFVTGSSLTGLEVCVRGYPQIPCETTDDVGAFTLSVPTNEEVVVAFSLEGYKTSLMHLVMTSDMTLAQFSIASDETLTFLVEQAGGVLDEAAGVIAIGTGTEGVVADMSPMSGIGPIYLSALNIPDGDLMATSPGGFFGFANVSAGEVEVLTTHDSMNCTFPRGWPGTNDGATRLTVEPDSLSWTFNLNCQ